MFLIQQWVTKVIGRGNNPYWPLPSNDIVHGYEHWGCFTLCFTLHWWLVKTVTRIFFSVTVLTSFLDCGIDNMATDDNQMKWQQKTYIIVCSLNENFSKSRSLSTVQWKTFKGENFREFRGFVAIYESFLREIGGWGLGGCPLAQQKRAIRENHIFHQFAKVFSLECFPLYSIAWVQLGVR